MGAAGQLRHKAALKECIQRYDETFRQRGSRGTAEKCRDAQDSRTGHKKGSSSMRTAACSLQVSISRILQLCIRRYSNSTSLRAQQSKGTEKPPSLCGKMGPPIVMFKFLAFVALLCCVQLAAAASDQPKQQPNAHGVISPGKPAASNAAKHITTHSFDVSKPQLSISNRSVPGRRLLTVKLSEASVSKMIAYAGQSNCKASSGDTSNTWQALKVWCPPVSRSNDGCTSGTPICTMTALYADACFK